MNPNWNKLTTSTKVLMLAALDAAHKVEKITMVPASIQVAQWAIESGWGTSELGLKAHNYFGMKAQPGDGWKGPVYPKFTQEFVQGHEITVKAEFRVYPTIPASFKDHGIHLTSLQYKKCFDYDTKLVPEHKYLVFAEGLQEAGYATDPTYAEQLISAIENYGWNWYDL
jgi:flagellum-specific peptidoglycan hydrolase FlgJ